ncbi:DegV family protein [Staphylococcus sp. SQ8-PEA]|uniref:DegV family protein n=1 Tax=Staphylococcus marylandisciuri TaxID=2981529 RepID=A0ABT2QNG1_9STAP|nr:DegV family protein [Staphylococcus marylandisciuri]MCU5745518.1 DegV family protein [Staphylococcus marylandisciuri]
MTNYKIVTDSTSDLSHEFLKKNQIHVVPLTLNIDNDSFADQEEISSETFLQKIEEGADVKTSQPPIGKFINLYNELGKDDTKIISIHMTSGLSGTYSTALQASQMTESDVTVIDSKSISYGLGYQIQHLCDWVKEDLSIEEITYKLKQLQKNIKLYVVIGQLSQLIKGGRIGKTKGLIGNMMKIKPIGTLSNGNLEMIHNSRTQKSVLQYLKKEINHFLDGYQLQSVGIAHANVLDFVEKVKHYFLEDFNFKNVDVNITTPVIATHTGQGAIGLVIVRQD